ncbi:hypothetical protein J3R30DRAFT_3772485 [Lentinula aciculospora]|uniref:F-box domain-containing protein n=1 Tax=Lentinula aciculospora TaxID=153920 RepID=A0A9W9A6F0_9AGAR|nr:hypothetical protein J3R30DRAFT_3772485 [Lentinula aciculospora]
MFGPSLQSLGLHLAFIEDAISPVTEAFREVPFPALRNLQIGHAGEDEETALIEVLKDSAKLRGLSIYECVGSSEEGWRAKGLSLTSLRRFAQACPKLTHVEFHIPCYQSLDAYYTELSTNLRNLQSFKLTIYQGFVSEKYRCKKNHRPRHDFLPPYLKHFLVGTVVWHAIVRQVGRKTSSLTLYVPILVTLFYNILGMTEVV